MPLQSKYAKRVFAVRDGITPDILSVPFWYSQPNLSRFGTPVKAGIVPDKELYPNKRSLVDKEFGRLGIDPVKLLKWNHASTNAVKVFKAGMFPDNWLSATKNLRSLVQGFILGIVPVSWFEKQYNSSIYIWFVKAEGIDPVNLLLLQYNALQLLLFVKSGIVPVILRLLSIWKFAKLGVAEKSGILPARRFEPKTNASISGNKLVNVETLPVNLLNLRFR